MNARAVGWIVLGVVLGFASGQALGRRELQALKRDHAALQHQLNEVERPSLLGALWSRLDERRPEPTPAQPAEPAAPEAEAEAAAVAPPAGQGDVAVIGSPGAAPAPAAGSARAEPVAQPGAAPAAPPAAPAAATDTRPVGRRERFRQRLEQFDTLAAAQRVRALAARSALINQAKLEPAKVAELDHTVKDMNDKLGGYGEEVIDQMSAEKAPSPSEALGLGHDVSGILFDGQQKLDTLVGDKAPEVDSSAREIWNYIDLEQWRPFAKQKLAETAPAEADSADTAAAPEPPGAAGNSGAKP